MIMIDFTKIPAEIKKIALCVTIHEAGALHQNFGQVSNAYIRIDKLADEFDTVGGACAEVRSGRRVLHGDRASRGELYTKDGERKFKAIAAGYQDSLEAICRFYGANV